jgi:hypothetical protein
MADIEHNGGACDPETACPSCALAYGLADMTEAAHEEQADERAHAEAHALAARDVEQRTVAMARVAGCYGADDIEF